MPQNWTARLPAWTGDLSTMQQVLAATLVALVLMLVLYGLQRRRQQGLGADIDWLRAETRQQADELDRRARHIAALEPELRAEAQAARDHALRAGQLDERLAGRETRLAELVEERDGLTDVLHRERQAVSRLERELAETRLAAEKDRETAARDVETLRALREEMTGQFRLMAHETLKTQGAEMQKAHGEQLHALLNPFRDQVHRFQTELQTRNKATDEERARLKEQIEYLHKRSEDISREAVALTRALKGDSQKRGAWGEMILERILEDSGLIAGTHYDIQTSRRDADGRLWRPDVIVRMPQEKALVIDSKVSLNAYELFSTAEEDGAREAALRRHLDSIRGHIKDLSAKNYQEIHGLAALDFVILFVPIEPAFLVAITRDSELWQHAWVKNIMLVSPSSLLFVVRIVAQLWQKEQQTRNAQEIARRGAELYDKLVGFVDDLDKVGKGLKQAQDAYDRASLKFARGKGNAIRQAEMLKGLGVKPTRQLDPALVETAFDDDSAALPSPAAGADGATPPTAP